MNKTIHRGIIANGGKIYYTDDIDSLPADIIGYQKWYYENFSWVEFLRMAMQGEQKGFSYNIQIGELFYETPGA